MTFNRNNSSNKPIPVSKDGVVDHVALLPKKWSPSRLSEDCLRKQYFKTILKLSEPPTIDTIRGQLFHSVAERMFDVPAEQRTADHAKMLIAGQWEVMHNPAPLPADASGQDHVQLKYARATAAGVRDVVAIGSDVETSLFASVEVLIDNWMTVEDVAAPGADPSAIRFPDGTVGDGREVHVTGAAGSVTIHGFVDRINMWADPSGATHAMIADYKTGKAPPPRFQHKSFFQLRLYALAFQQMYGSLPTWLRLIYLKGTPDPADGGPTPVKVHERVSENLIKETEAEISARHKKIVTAAETRTWPTTVGPLCNWCYFADICPAAEKAQVA
jgi:putative RecB family exonuclease